MGIAGLILGCFALVFDLATITVSIVGSSGALSLVFCAVAFIASLTGLVLSSVAMKKKKNGVAVAGFVINIVALVAALLVLAFVAFILYVLVSCANQIGNGSAFALAVMPCF